jgi:hypothetical protein
MKCSSFRGPGTWSRLLAWSGKSLEELPRLALLTAAVVKLVVPHLIFGLSSQVMYFSLGLDLKCFLSFLAPAY